MAERDEELERRAPDQRRTRVLDATEELLQKSEPPGMTMSDVADRAGVAKGTVYLYFSSKDELIAGVRARYLERLSALLEEVAQQEQDPTDRLREFILSVFDFFLASSRLHRAIFHEAGFSEEDAFENIRARLTALLREGAGSGHFDVPDEGAVSAFLLQGIHGVLLDAIHRPTDPTDSASIAAELATRAIQRH